MIQNLFILSQKFRSRCLFYYNFRSISAPSGPWGIRVWHGISQVEGRDFVTCALVNSRGQSFMTSNPPPKKTKEQSNQWLKEQALLNQTEETTVQELTLTWYTLLFLWFSACIQRKPRSNKRKSRHKHNFLKSMRFFSRSPNAQHRTSVAFPTALSSSKKKREKHGYHALLFSLVTSGEGWARWLIGHDSG